MSDTLKMLKLGDVPWKVYERAHQSLANYEKRVVQPKADEDFGEAGRFCMSYKRPHTAPLPACVLQPTIANTPNRALSASVPNHSPAKVRSANTKLPAERNVWKCSCADFAGIKLA